MRHSGSARQRFVGRTRSRVRTYVTGRSIPASRIAVGEVAGHDDPLGALAEPGVDLGEADRRAVGMAVAAVTGRLDDPPERDADRRRPSVAGKSDALPGDQRAIVERDLMRLAAVDASPSPSRGGARRASPLGCSSVTWSTPAVVVISRYWPVGSSTVHAVFGSPSMASAGRASGW